METALQYSLQLMYICGVLLKLLLLVEVLRVWLLEIRAGFSGRGMYSCTKEKVFHSSRLYVYTAVVYTFYEVVYHITEHIMYYYSSTYNRVLKEF